ncbi:MAG TPA: DUF4142 domain-containing protein [Polyangiaceae bacterium]|nr:DUF4142 domain-containing protein [Polyangiaceae bacterium]
MRPASGTAGPIYRPTRETSSSAPSEQSSSDLTPASGANTPEELSPSREAYLTAPPGQLSDPQIAAISDVANNAEVEQAKIARRKSSDPRVRNFADMMIAHHGKAKQDQALVELRFDLTPAPSATSRQLGTDAANTLTLLRDADATDFDRVYIDSQVDAHQKVLDTLDQDLIPNVRNEELKTLLQGIRPTVAMHLRRAREIQGQLAAGARSNLSEKR